MIERKSETISHTDLFRALSRPRLTVDTPTITPEDLRGASNPVDNKLPYVHMLIVKRPNRIYEEDCANETRLAACVNGCAGIQNPAAVADAVAALREIAEHNIFTVPQIEIRDKAKAALAALEKESK